MSELVVQGLRKSFGNNVVVNDISFSVQEGEFFVLLGPSGGGKSTTLRLICGLEQPDSGKIVLGNQDITNLTPRQRNLGMVFQDYGLYPNMTVFGNIAYGLETRHVAKNEVDKRVRSAAEMLGLTSHLPRSINDLSGGEQQRVALARCLAKDAELFLFDEPLSNLDPKLRFQARRDILNVHRTKKKPSLYVTHDQSEAFAVGDRIAVIAKGRLQQVGTPDELINFPSNVFMARFIGTPPMNTLTGQLVRGNGAFAVAINGLTIPLPAKWNAILQNYQQNEIILGLPPTAIVQQEFFTTVDHQVYQIPAEVLDIESQIGESILTLKLGNDLTAQAQFSDGEEAHPNVGDRIKVGVNLEALKLFDPISENAIKVE
ncbi:ABC transporter ATP-binding protein [Tengunoibacter tsumagoiensis]|uniref:Sugar ABC transporter ATP-binding protein n=1 Tax=Tengunoibacter tsumagoiensis TaxID=2014871 RepID=A0A402A449_9CHLR|nr:ABC transporter ATP-binding protein [Tengunoibacter tsumagoiensis]GCE13781.1 sugar ABC transporter ATP-binding protein [Tengunoibacter tsumagoiensis]